MNLSRKSYGRLVLVFLGLWVQSGAFAQENEIPDVLKPWESWVTWDAPHRDCPTPYNDSSLPMCSWPSRLRLAVDAHTGSWNIDVTVFEASWVGLPGDGEMWPVNVRADGKAVVVVLHEGIPSVKLAAGRHGLAGEFAWDVMPQRIAIPKQIGLLTLNVDGNAVPIPNWDANGDVWLKRRRAEEVDTNRWTAQVYRIIEDGIPLWLRTEIEIAVSGQSREEDLGWILPQGWNLSYVESPIPVAVDELGRMKGQVRAGKWKIRLHAFRTVDAQEIQFAPDSTPITPVELIGFRAQPDFRMAEIEGLPAMDVSQTTFPEAWRNLPVYRWDIMSPFRLVEKMRGMGLGRPEGLGVQRQLWLDDDGQGLTFRDRLQGQMQQIWRLDVAQGHDLGAVRVNGEGQLITTNPATDARGVEIRTQNLNMQAIGRVDRTPLLSAAGWQTDVDALEMTLVLPPGWRLFALFGADHVQGDWLTAWSLLDLFLLLIFTLAVFRMWGFTAGVVAFLAFGLAYHEPGAPRFAWLLLLMPIALLRVVKSTGAVRWATRWKYLSTAILLLCLIPFVAGQVQSLIYPQLERPGLNYAPRGLSRDLGFQTVRPASKSGPVIDAGPLDAMQNAAQTAEYGRRIEVRGLESSSSDASSRPSNANMSYTAQAKIQTGPAEPEWDWNQVHCQWTGPVSADQTIRPILISRRLHRALTLLRLVLLIALSAIVLGVRNRRWPFFKRAVATAALFWGVGLPNAAVAQIPDAQMLDSLRQRLLEPSDAYPHAAEISSVQLSITENRIVMSAVVHAATRVAVPLPGRLPAWSPLSVRVNDESDNLIRRHDDFLWVTVPQGIHQVVVEGLLPDVTEWEWAHLLKPRRVTIDAPGWTVTGIRDNGVVSAQVFFVREQATREGDAAYDRRDFKALVAVNRQLEIGLVWKIHTRVTRLSAGKNAISLRIPVVQGEQVLTSGRVVREGLVDVQLDAGQEAFSWTSELPIGEDIRLTAPQTDRWVERWELVTSPVWNVSLSGIRPVFEAQQASLIPVWRAWPGEALALSFRQPHAVTGDTLTVQSVQHETFLGDRQSRTTLKLIVESSLGDDFVVDLDQDADISSLSLDGKSAPVRRNGRQLILPVHPGRQVVEIAWRSPQPMSVVSRPRLVTLPVDGSNVMTVIHVPDVPESRWVLWADGPMRGPAVRFWTILACAILAAWILGRLPTSPLRRIEWVLLVLGLTQVHLIPALIVVGWFFVIAWRGGLKTEWIRPWQFALMQIGLVIMTGVTLVILIVVVGQGLLGNPDMFIAGNGSWPTRLRWFQPRSGPDLPVPYVVSVSVWFFRLLMLFWALWLASSLLRWLKWAWEQFTQGESWKRVLKRKAVTVSQE